MTDKKAEILKALRTIYPLPQDLITEVTNIDDAVVDALHTTWMRRLNEDWFRRRPNDGDAIYNALHPQQQGKKMDDKKARILAALQRVRPLPTDLIAQVEGEEDEACFDQWLGRSRETWRFKRPVDGDDIYNALHPQKQGLGWRNRDDWWNIDTLDASDSSRLLGDICTRYHQLLLNFAPTLPTVNYRKLNGDAATILSFPNGRPSMLLETVFGNGEKSGLEVDFRGAPQILAVLGTSGVGKTAGLLFTLSQSFGLYFAASTHHEFTPFGSKDLEVMIEKAELRCKQPDQKSRNMQFVARYFSALYAGRLMILAILMKRPQGVTPLDFLLLQIFPSYFVGFDIFAAAVENFRKMSLSTVNDAICSFKAEISPYLKQYGGLNRLIAFMDESQVLCDALPECFKNARNEPRPLLTALSTLFKDDFLQFTVFAGTGLRVTTFMSTAASPFLPNASIIVSHTASADKVSRLVETYIGTSAMTPAIARNFRGRHRSIARLIQVYADNSSDFQSIDLNRDVEDATVMLRGIFDEMISKVSVKLQGNGFLHHHILTMLADLVLAFAYTGRPVSMSIPSAENNIVDLLAAGIAILDKTPRSQYPQYKLRITEPLLAATVLRSELVKPHTVPSHTQSSDLGFYAERLFSKTLCKWLSDWVKLDDIEGLDVPIQLKGREVKIYNANSVEMIFDGEFIDWSDDERPVCHPQDWLGPDAVFKLQVRKFREDQYTLLPCAAQYNLRKSATLAACMASLAVDNFGKGKADTLPQTRVGTVNSLVKYLGPEYLKLALVWPSFVSSNQPTSTSVLHPNKPFHMVVSGDMMSSVFSDEDREYLKAAKDYCDRVDQTPNMEFDT